MKVYRDLFNKIVDPEALFTAWKNFRIDKGNKPDVLLFEGELERNIFKLSRELLTKKYMHSGYTGFYISDPKLRRIHKASVRDRVLHHAISSVLTPIFEPSFIANSFSCRIGKGSHKGVKTLKKMLDKESKNNTKTCYVLKCDVQKFFDSIDQNILLSILKKRIKDGNVIWLLENLIGSYASDKSDLFCRRGVPIGNLTSQLFANVYMNEFDQFMKQKLKVRYFARYTDDFIVLSRDKEYLIKILSLANNFLEKNLSLQLHPGKVEILTYTKGVDFLGYVLFPTHTLLRRRTKRRIRWKFENRILEYRKEIVKREKVEASLQSYLGILSHANEFKFSTALRNFFDLWVSE